MNSDEQQSSLPADRERQASDIHDDHAEPMLFCPVCNMQLAPLKCKLICERCGYYMSCSDYY